MQREKRKIGEEIERGHDCGKERGSATKKGKREIKDGAKKREEASKASARRRT